MKHNEYTFKEFLVDSRLDQIIIPEIQRDYVWGKEHVLCLLNTISEKYSNKITKKVSEAVLDGLDADMKMLVRKNEEDRSKTNIGFIYAYHDKELVDQYILIDGQQRFTTIFLIVLCLAIKEKKINIFKNNYYFDNKLKIDYKVREATHDFLNNFVNYLLDGNSIDNIKNQYWYLDEYDNDKTIIALYENYKVINQELSVTNSFDYDYAENNIKFWYFNTDTSTQGEELYLYMNSRGELVTQCENIKANLIKNQETSENKNKLGKEWEEWQAFFWKRRMSNLNADTGFHEYLVWITIIEHIKHFRNNNVDSTSKEIKKIHDDNKIEIKYLDFNVIKEYYTAIKIIDEIKMYNNDYLIQIKDLFSKKLSAIDYFRLLPVIMLIKSNNKIDNISIIRFGRFFSNLSKKQNINGSPYDALVNAVRMTLFFIEKKHTDITNLINLSKAEISTMILSNEEIDKLTIYQKHPDLREETEKLFWDAEDYIFCGGSLDFLFKCISPKIDPESFNKETLDSFNLYYESYKTLLSNQDDLLRRALLTKGDYKIKIGTSPSLGYDMRRNTFIYTLPEWTEYIISGKYSLMECIKALLIEYVNLKQPINSDTKNNFLNETISNYTANSKTKEWLYYFVKYPEILKYCRYKIVCFGSDDFSDIYLFTGVIANEYKKLSDFIIEIEKI